jgi:hypothetical protein
MPSYYRMVEWAADGFSFVAVSGLEPGELEAFVADHQKAAGP